MPHCVVEYTDNLVGEVDVPALLRKLADRLCDSDGMFPKGGVRVRAQRLTEYAIADGANPDDAFVHLTVKIGKGRTRERLDAFFADFFEAARQALAPVFARRPLALSLYVDEVDEAGSYKQNTIHTRFK
jgi:5-carboxymethyl-2-hydroxymuconate isomerase